MPKFLKFDNFSFSLIIFATTAAIFYLYTKPTIAISFLCLLPIIFIIFQIFKDANIQISFSAFKAGLMILSLIPVMALYSYLIFLASSGMALNLPAFLNAFFVNFFLSSAISIFMALSSFSLGVLILKRRDVLGVAFGFITLSLELFLLLALGGFYAVPVLLIIGIPIVVFGAGVLRGKIGGIREIGKILKQKIYLKQDTALAVLIFMVFVASVIAVSVKGFVEGPDGLRQYLNVTKFIALNHRLPDIKIFVSNPFPFEILAAVPFLLNGVTSAKFFLNTFLFFIAVELYFIAKKIKIENYWIPIIIVLTHPIIYYLTAVEFKTDIFLIFLLLAGFLAYLENSAILFFFFSFSYIVKPTALFMAVPFCVFFIYRQIAARKLKSGVCWLFISLIPVVVWALIWRIPIPLVGDISFKDHSYFLKLADTSSCGTDIVKYEQEKFYGGYKDPLKTSSSISSLTDSGIFYFVFILLSALTLFRKIKIKEKLIFPNTTIFVLLAVSFIPWFAARPDALWYNAAPFLLIVCLFWSFIENNLSKDILRPIIIFVGATSVAYMLLYSFIDPYITYIPPNVTDTVLYKTKSGFERRAFGNIYDAGEIVGKDNSRIIFSASLPFVKIDYFFANSQERVLYFDRISNYYKNPNAFKDLVTYENISYAIYFNEADSTNLPCVLENQRIAKNLFELYGDTVLENGSVKVYKFKLW